MSLLHTRAAPPTLHEPPPDLARGWYVLTTSADVGIGSPTLTRLAGREFVAWRTDDGRAVVMDRHCPHQGAGLELGTVVGGSIRCPFHHWRFAADGRCVAAPDTRRIPDHSDARVLQVWEGLGFIWVWWGSASPSYPPPDFPPLRVGRAASRRYRFSYATPASARRILENGFDVTHFPVVHGLRPRAPLQMRWLPTDVAHVASAQIVADSLIPAALAPLVATGELRLTLRSTPSYQTLAFELGDRAIAHELLAVSPRDRDETVMTGWTVVLKGRGALGSAPVYWAYRLQHWQGTRADLKIYRDVTATGSSVNTPSDEGVLRFRQFYRRWRGDPT